jgi:hypothetical protein
MANSHLQQTETLSGYITKVDYRTYQSFDSFDSSEILNVCYPTPKTSPYFYGAFKLNVANKTGNAASYSSSYYSDSACEEFAEFSLTDVLPLECRPGEDCTKFVISDAPLVTQAREYTKK